jgi:hypothetical protein
MARTLARLLVLASALLLLAACSGDSKPKTFSPENSYTETFDSGQDWPQQANDNAAYGSADGRYLIYLKRTPRAVMVGSNKLFRGEDLVVGDSIQTLQTWSNTNVATATSSGLLCRWNEQVERMTGYAFHISSRNGPKWTILRSIDGETQVLKEGKAAFDPNQKTRLEASCVGDTLTFKVNGVEVGSASDSELEEGSNGILSVAIPRDKPPAAALYDDYSLKY